MTRRRAPPSRASDGPHRRGPAWPTRRATDIHGAVPRDPDDPGAQAAAPALVLARAVVAHELGHGLLGGLRGLILREAKAAGEADQDGPVPGVKVTPHTLI